WTRVHLFVETRFTQFNDLPTTAIRVYTPPGYQGKSLGRPYPVLYMLSPFRGDEFFYLQHGLQVVMDRLIDEGVIEPMIVVSVNASGNTFGGSFYGNYVTNGDYLNLVSHSLAPFIDTQFNTFGNLPLVGSVPNTPQLRADLRAISGYEMGGYGAFRAALTSGDISTGLPSEFGSVSAISAPLNFTDPIYGFQNLFAGAIAEWGSYDAIDPSQTTPISSFLIAAAIGFSPEDTAYKLDPSNPFQVDTVYKILDSSNIDTAIDTFPLETNIVFITIDTVIDTPTIDTTIGSTVLFDSFFDTSFFDTTIDTLVTIDSLFDTTITFDTFVLPGTTIILVDTIVDTTIFPPDTMFDTMIDTPPLDSARVDTILTIFDTLIDTSFLFTIDSMFNPIDTTFDIRTEDTFLTYNPPTDLMFAAVPNPLTQEDNILRIFLPFDSLAQPYDSIWPVWQRNDIANLVDNVDVSVLNSFSDQMLIMATRDAKFAHFQQDSLLFAKLNSMGYTAHFVEYSGYDGFADVDGARYLFEVWPTLLKFHSDRFHEFIPPELQIENYKKGF
ncbi:MAG: alpha/beta hydrolase, partial [Candidatus Zixiibacteriota bacterium]